MKKIFIFSVFFILLALSSATAKEKTIFVHIFSQTGCPHCARAISFLENLQKENKNIDITIYDLRKDPHYYNDFLSFGVAYNITPEGVPMIYIGDKAINGYNEFQIESAIEKCQLPVTTCQNPKDIVTNFFEKNPELKNIPKTNNTKSNFIILGIFISVVVGIIMTFYFLKKER